MEETIVAMCVCPYTRAVCVCVSAMHLASAQRHARHPCTTLGPVCQEPCYLWGERACLCVCVCKGDGTICCGVQCGRRCSEMVHVGVVVGSRAEPERYREGIKRYWGRKHGCVCMVGDVGQFLEGTHCPS